MSQPELPAAHTFALPQQGLLLESLKMSGEIAVMGAENDSLLWSTVHESHSHRWIILHKLSDTATKFRLANGGHDLLKS